VEVGGESQPRQQHPFYGFLWTGKSTLGTPPTPQQADTDPIGQSHLAQETFSTEFGG
jgi:hypothetical protein